MSQSWWRAQDEADSSDPKSATPQVNLNIPEDGATERLPTRRIHIMGLGSIGTFVAHSLMCLPNPPPITLLLHRKEMYDDFCARRRIVRLIDKKTRIHDEARGYDIDLLETDSEDGSAYWKHIPHQPNPKEPPATPPAPEEMMSSGEVWIHHLVVAVKGPNTVRSLLNVKHRITAKTTICLIQNGLGQVDELNQKVFKDPSTRPIYMLGVTNHGVYLFKAFNAIHAGFGTVALGIVRDLDKFPLPRGARILSSTSTSTTPTTPTTLSESDRKRMYPTDADLYENISSRFLLRTLTRSPILACAAVPYLDLFQLQLEKLVVNCIINPITALLNVPNGALLGNSPIARVERLLMAEISTVIRHLPELEGVPNVHTRFAPERLEVLCVGMYEKTSDNSSSMREDIRKTKETEIQYINGYIVRRGEEQGIKCVLNYMITQLVMGKSWASKLADEELIPYGVQMLRGKMSKGFTGKVDGVVGREGEVMLEDTGTPEKGSKL